MYARTLATRQGHGNKCTSILWISLVFYASRLQLQLQLQLQMSCLTFHHLPETFGDLFLLQISRQAFHCRRDASQTDTLKKRQRCG